ncbi:TRAP transporter small permease [Alteribacillus sp. YIM 98480]|uniref:TRAP transporter small permease n=1 Tax=Alteribacillus sp. YIM 98480 TaxID=2606599 RepID=UPI00131C02FB|nr:TRAP transporter small permease [Alteribacillus sp. YIM 98480]
MHYLNNVIGILTRITKWGALFTILLMMVLITVSIISRAVFNAPIIGDYELVELMMVVLIGLGLAYAESIDSHIKVGLLVDRLHTNKQTVINMFVNISVFAVCMLLGTVQFNAGISSLSGMQIKTSLLQIPHYPFQFLLAIGFYLWGLEALLKTIYTIITLFTKQRNSTGEEKENAS